MEVTVLIQPLNGAGFRASTGEPLPAAAEGATREEALGKLRALLQERAPARAELVRLQLPVPREIPAAPIWPDDEITRAWLEGIAAARQAADRADEPWADAAGPDQP